MTADPFDDIDGLRIDPEDPSYVGKVAKARQAKWQRKFVHVPWVWLDRLKVSNRGSTYRLAMFLIYEYWRNGGRPIRLSNGMLTSAGITRRSKDRALQELERFKLIKVERHPRKSPLVTVMAIPKT